MRLVCRCHGMSGSCTVRNCWWRLSSFRQVGDWLKARFDGAARVRLANDGVHFTTRDELAKWPAAQDLIYTETSPDFCLADPRFWAQGTQGRRCEPDSKALHGCELMCCGRGHRTVRKTVRFNCRCSFQWCCDVRCDQCERQVLVHVCR